MKTSQLFLTALLIFCSWFWACTPNSDDDATANIEAIDDYNSFPYSKLSDYGFFEGQMANLEHSDKLLPYTLNAPLFSNYAQKSRHIYIPQGKTAQYVDDAVLDFPTGTIIIKTFYYLADIRNENSEKNILETRLLVKEPTEWIAYSYIWNQQQTDANYALVGKQLNVSWIHYNGETKTANYQIPNKIECQSCHSLNDKIVPIGPKARNLNKMMDYKSGEMNQLQKWIQQGWLTGLPSNAPFMPNYLDENSGDLNSRARAYLDINCGHCHYPGAPADNSGLYLNYTNTDSLHLGICKPAVAAGSGSGGLKYDIVPQKPEESIMMFRMNSVQLDQMMPETGRSIVHTEGNELIKLWIESLNGDCN